jgi:hypothetical protein
MKLYPLMICLFILVACNDTHDTADTTASNEESKQVSNPAGDTANYTTVRWIDSVENLGVLTKGENKEISFRFVNTGDKPLFIISANPGCGCTVADYPKEPIQPGEEGTIKAGYDTKNQHVGAFHKSISVVTNTLGNASHNLVFTGEIITDEKTVSEQTPEPVATGH